jgi:hypothetical protein
MKWSDLAPEPGIEAALRHADSKVALHRGSTQNEKRHWSESFANQCAVAFADELRKAPELRKKRVLPTSLADGTEPLTPLGSATSKRIDVTVADPVLGLEIGVSLKGLNFRDAASENYDKNLTGRLYELADEVRLVHEHLPHAFMVGVFFLPLPSAVDKSEAANSSFANAVLKLRSRTGRLDTALAAHAARCDAAYVGLYANGAGSPDHRAGVVRFLNVDAPPPRRGRPKVETTLSLAEVVRAIVDKATFRDAEIWAEPEPER